MQTPLLTEIELTGAASILRPLREEDASLAFPMIHRRREVLDWLIWTGPDTLEQLAEVYSRWLLPGQDACSYRLAIVEKATGDFAGSISVRFVDSPREADIGYWLGSSYWGRGLGTEAVFLAGWLAFHHLGAQALSAEVFDGNDASRRVLEKNGYVRDPRPLVAKNGRPEHRFDLTRERFVEELASWQPPLERVR